MPAKTAQPSENLHNPYGYSDMDWAAQLDPAYAAARAEVRRLSVRRGRDTIGQSEGTDRAGRLGVAGPPVWRGGPHAPGDHIRRHEGGIVRGHQSRRRPWRWRGL
jgi:hypothetical protein